MDYKTYLSHCLVTWGGENRRSRCALAIIEEMGEVVGKYQKFLRGDYKYEMSGGSNLIKFKEDIGKEFGDLMFYITVMIFEFKQEYGLEDFDIDFDAVINQMFDVTLFRGKGDEVMKNCAFRMFDYLAALERTNNYDSIFRSMYAVVLQLAYNRFMLLPEDILNQNIEKLQDRKKRGVIAGSGDNR